MGSVPSHGDSLHTQDNVSPYDDLPVQDGHALDQYTTSRGGTFSSAARAPVIGVESRPVHTDASSERIVRASFADTAYPNPMEPMVRVCPSPKGTHELFDTKSPPSSD